MEKYKKNKLLLVIFFAGVAFILGVIFSIKNKSFNSDDIVKEKTESQSEIAFEQNKHDHSKEIWTCPMHPQIKKDGPGTCPICGMNLVKSGVAGEANSENSKNKFMPEGHAPLQLSLLRQQMIGVKVGQVQKKLLFKSIDAAGRIAFDPELYTAQNEFVEAVKQAETVKNSPIVDVKHSADRMVDSAKLRLKILGLSDSQIYALGRNGTTGSNLLVPKQGENLWVYAEVFEMDLSSIQSGLEATISGGSLGRNSLKGKVASVDRVINSMTRTAKVRILIPNTSVILRPEAYVDVSIHSPLGEQITVPFDAILDTGKQAWVFVVRENGEFDPRLVTIVDRAGEEVAIASGVHPGEKIVTSANFLVDSESRLKGVLYGQSEEPNVTDSEDSKLNESDEFKKEVPNKKEGKAKPSTPECPKGQFWHEQMNHCMPKM
jgi:Cu(I)/Ag(I) efflux system membrane fusion protein